MIGVTNAWMHLSNHVDDGSYLLDFEHLCLLTKRQLAFENEDF